MRTNGTVLIATTSSISHRTAHVQYADTGIWIDIALMTSLRSGECKTDQTNEAGGAVSDDIVAIFLTGNAYNSLRDPPVSSNERGDRGGLPRRDVLPTNLRPGDMVLWSYAPD